MADYDATINYDPNQTPPTYLTGGAVTLSYSDSLTISIGTGFPAGTMSVTALGFFNVVNGGKGNTPLGNWSRSGGSSLPAGLAITGNADGSVTIQDGDTLADQDYYYNCTAQNASTKTNYQADPELIVRKKPTSSVRVPRPGIAPEV